jgi:hypothetical protein
MGHGGGPTGQMRAPQMMRRGTSKAVPVVVSAGLAVGVFCGLLFGLGTGDEVQAAGGPAEKKFVSTTIPGTEDPAATTPSVVPPKSVIDGTTPTPTPTPATGSAGSAVTPATGSAGGATITAPEPAIKAAKLKIELKPDAIAATAKITVDGNEVTGGTYDVTLGDATKKQVKVVVKASGYKHVEQTVELEEGDTTLKVELVKRSSGGGLKRPPPPGGSGKQGGGKKDGGGLIDI